MVLPFFQLSDLRPDFPNKAVRLLDTAVQFAALAHNPFLLQLADCHAHVDGGDLPVVLVQVTRLAVLRAPLAVFFQGVDRQDDRDVGIVVPFVGQFRPVLIGSGSRLAFAPPYDFNGNMADRPFLPAGIKRAAVFKMKTAALDRVLLIKNLHVLNKEAFRSSNRSDMKFRKKP